MILKIALTKGRVEEQFMELLDKLQIDITPFRNKQRELIIDLPGYQFILAKGPDVMTFVNRGVVDLGIVGSDLLMEQGNERNELMDLKIGQCQFILASVAGFDVNAPGRKTIGTRYPRVAARYFDRLGQDVEIIKIEGSVELAPLIQLTDAIIDITETGTTLRENNLVVYDRLTKVSTRLVANTMALRHKKTAILNFMHELSSVIPES